MTDATPSEFEKWWAFRLPDLQGCTELTVAHAAWTAAEAAQKRRDVAWLRDKAKTYGGHTFHLLHDLADILEKRTDV